MKPWLAIVLLLPLAGCHIFRPEDLFYIAQTDRPIRSASLQLCQKDFPLGNVDGTFEASIHVPGDCDGALHVLMVDGSEVSCSIGYATPGNYSWRFEVKNGRCTGGIELAVKSSR